MLVDNLTDLVIFSQAVKEGSLSAAGRELGFSAAVVSKRLQRLEERLGVRLINRSTRRLGLTEEGASYYEYCQRVLAELEEAEALITRGASSPKGNLRVTVPSAFGRLHVAPLVPIFLRRCPDIQLSLHLSDSVADLIDEGFDLAIRIGDLKDSNLVARRLGTDRRVVVATPSYIAKFGAPRIPSDLALHNALLYASPTPFDHWQFTNSKGDVHGIRVSGNFETNNCDALREAILADLGIALRPLWDVWQDLRSGAMIQLLPDFTPPSFPIQAVYPSRRHLSQKVRLFVDLLVETFGETPYWETEAAGAAIRNENGARGAVP